MITLVILEQNSNKYYIILNFIKGNFTFNEIQFANFFDFIRNKREFAQKTRSMFQMVVYFSFILFVRL